MIQLGAQSNCRLLVEWPARHAFVCRVDALPNAVPMRAAGTRPGAAASSDKPLQVQVPLLGSVQASFVVMLWRRGGVLARLQFQCFGLLPLLLNEHVRTLTLVG